MNNSAMLTVQELSYKAFINDMSYSITFKIHCIHSQTLILGEAYFESPHESRLRHTVMRFNISARGLVRVDVRVIRAHGCQR